LDALPDRFSFHAALCLAGLRFAKPANQSATQFFARLVCIGEIPCSGFSVSHTPRASLFRVNLSVVRNALCKAATAAPIFRGPTGFHLVRFSHYGGENFRQNADMKCESPVLGWLRTGCNNRVTPKMENQFVPNWNAPF
jgi:hypothetical protein